MLASHAWDPGLLVDARQHPQRLIDYPFLRRCFYYFRQSISRVSKAKNLSTLPRKTHHKSSKHPFSTDHDNSMDTPPSPPPIPLNSPLRTHPKRGLPNMLSSTTPHGHISGHARTPSQQAAFTARKDEILRTMTPETIEARYQDTVAQICRVLDENRILAEKVESEMVGLSLQREMERGIWEKLKGRKEGG